MKKEKLALLKTLIGCFILTIQVKAQSHTLIHIIHPLNLTDITVNDSFWSPKYTVWDTKTVYDVFDKLEGKYIPDRQDLIDAEKKKGATENSFLNFDRVASGDKDTKQFDGLPWFDGLIYETIRGAADLMIEYPDPNLENKIDTYINRIAAAQDADANGYLNTYTTLNRPNERFGTNGGDDKWQHDSYNSGMLIDAGIHYYNATGKTKLLNVAVKQANYICSIIGPYPKINAIPGHAGPEEAMLSLYQLFKTHPELKTKVREPVNEMNYYNMAKFWIENRGNYGNANGRHTRKSDSSYNQDHLPVFEQTTIEGHAVRATLLASGVTAMAIQNNDPSYINTANNYWDNMTGKKMFITGGEGAIADGERFGKNYYLPESAYLETCASIGAGFFSERMNELEANGKYIDELERIMYNNLLSGVSLTGDHYFYENPLIATDHKRWSWHSCPCCPPMILKMVGALPKYIYAYDDNSVYVNLFIGSTANISFNNYKVMLKQETGYPWKGNVKIEVDPKETQEFSVRVRVPGWAVGKENPFDLYHSSLNGQVKLVVNSESIPVHPVNGYVDIKRTWKKGDEIELQLPMQPRFVYPNDSVQTIKSKVAISAGPIVYAFEKTDNPQLNNYAIDTTSDLEISYQPQLLNGVNVVKGEAITNAAQKVSFTAIPFYALGNRGPGASYTVWLPAK